MDLTFSDQDEAFRDEVRGFLAEHLSEDMRAAAARITTVFADKELAMRWQRVLATRGWAAPAWPEEFGGTGWSVTRKYIFAEESARAGAPGLIPLGLRMLAPVLFRYGTPEQQSYYLPRILSGEPQEPRLHLDLVGLYRDLVLESSPRVRDVLVRLGQAFARVIVEPAVIAAA